MVRIVLYKEFTRYHEAVCLVMVEALHTFIIKLVSKDFKYFASHNVCTVCKWNWHTSTYTTLRYDITRKDLITHCIQDTKHHCNTTSLEIHKQLTGLNTKTDLFQLITKLVNPIDHRLLVWVHVIFATDVHGNFPSPVRV